MISTNYSFQNSLYYRISLITLILFMGLFFQAAWQYPVVDSFPLIERLLNPSFLSNDFYTNTFDEFSPRLILATGVVWVSEALNVHYTYVVGYGNIIRIWIYAIGLYLFFKQLSNNHVALIALALSSLSFLSVPFLPAWWPVTFDFTASNVALTLTMFAWVMTLKKKVAYALTILSFAVIIHPLVGVHGLLIALVLFISYHGWQAFFDLFKDIRVYITGLLFCGAFLALYLSFDKVLSNEDFVNINGFYRHAHHFIFSHMDVEKWISTFLMLIISIGMCFSLDIPKRLKATFICITVYAIFMTVIGYIFIEVIPTRFMVSFIPMRAFPVLVPLIVLMWSLFAWQTFKKKDYLVFFVLFLPFLPYGKVGLTWFLFPDHHELILPLLMIIFSISFAFISMRFPVSTKGLNNIIGKFVTVFTSQPKPALLILPIALMALVISFIRFELNIPTVQSEASIYKWINEHTDENSIVLSELNAANNQKIRLLSKRSVVISKDFPFNEKYYNQWYKRYSAVYSERDSARGHVDTLSPIQLNSIMDEYNATILIRTKQLSNNPYFSLISEVNGESKKSYIYKNDSVSTL